MNGYHSHLEKQFKVRKVVALLTMQIKHPTQAHHRSQDAASSGSSRKPHPGHRDYKSKDSGVDGGWDGDGEALGFPK